MRGPEGPVRGGVTRCGRPPPRLRGRGRGKTSRLSILSPACLPWTIVSASRLSFTMLAGVSTLSDVFRSGSDRKLPVAVPIAALSRFIRRETTFPRPRRFPVVCVSRKSRRKESTSAWKKEQREKETEKGSSDVAIIERTGRRSLWRLSSCSSGCCADIGVTAERRLSLAVRSTARERSGPGTGLFAALKRGHRPLSRLTMVSPMPRRPLDRCDTCRRSRRRHGVALNWRTLCHLPAPRDHWNRTRACRDLDAPTSRG